MYKDDTIVALSTPIGEGGISMVRLSGPDAFAIADKIFAPKSGVKPSKCKTHTIHYGHIIANRQTPNTKHQTPIIDEVLLTVMRSPRTYTREDIVEINCHGGIQAAKDVLEIVIKSGARIASPGEFTKKAFLSGRIDLSQAEAVLDIIRARTEGALKIAMSQLAGGLSDKVKEIREKVIYISSSIEASIDFPEEELDIIKEEKLIKKTEEVIDDLKGLIDTFGEGVILRNGILAVICGKPNVGKSSLMNLLLKRDRVIVTPIPGTTRDAVEEMISLKGILIRLVDTAGIAKTLDPVEREGIKKSKDYLDCADLVILMLDASTKMDRKDLDIIKLIGDKKKLVVINKIDLAKKMDKKRVSVIFRDEEAIEISVNKKTNIGSLERAISEMIWSGKVETPEPVTVADARHKELLDKSLENMLSVKAALKGNVASELVSVDLKEAVFNLGLIIGKSVSDDILDRIFEQFCIGK